MKERRICRSLPLLLAPTHPRMLTGGVLFSSRVVRRLSRASRFDLLQK